MKCFPIKLKRKQRVRKESWTWLSPPSSVGKHNVPNQLRLLSEDKANVLLNLLSNASKQDLGETFLVLLLV